MIAAVLVVVACSDSGSPATTPVVTTPPEPTTTMPATTTTTTEPVVTTTSSAPETTAAPTTTVARIAEVQAIIQDLEERRLDALFREDEEAFRELFANDAYLELSLEVLGNLEFVAEPTDVIVEVREILADTGECLAVELFSDFSAILSPEAVGTSTILLERTGSAWGYSYGGSDWNCRGPHPLGA